MYANTRLPHLAPPIALLLALFLSATLPPSLPTFSLSHTHTLSLSVSLPHSLLQQGILKTQGLGVRTETPMPKPETLN